MMTNDELQAAIDARPFEKVTRSMIEEKIAGVDYIYVREKIKDSTIIICNITMKNGFSFRGEAGCVDPMNYDQKIGEELSYRDAFGKIWAFEGYLLAEKRHGETNALVAEAHETASASLADPHQTMPPHQQRVIDEKNELDERLQKLDAFRVTTLFATLHPEEQARLSQQAGLMRQLLIVLEQRIAFF